MRHTTRRWLLLFAAGTGALLLCCWVLYCAAPRAQTGEASAAATPARTPEVQLCGAQASEQISIYSEHWKLLARLQMDRAGCGSWGNPAAGRYYLIRASGALCTLWVGRGGGVQITAQEGEEAPLRALQNMQQAGSTDAARLAVYDSARGPLGLRR